MHVVPRHLHDNGRKLYLLSRGADTTFGEILYTGWHCQGCRGITLIPGMNDEKEIQR